MGLAWDLYGGHDRKSQWNGMGLAWDKKSHPTYHRQDGEKICINTNVMKKVHFVLPLSLISGGSSSGM